MNLHFYFLIIIDYYFFIIIISESRFPLNALGVFHTYLFQIHHAPVTSPHLDRWLETLLRVITRHR